MVRAASSYTDLWLSPNFVVHRMQKIIETYGVYEARDNRRFQHEREAWTTALWGLGLTELYKREYWIEIEMRDSTPDTKLHRLDQSSGHNKIETYNVEVAEWEPHVDDLMQIILQKCGSAYPDYFGLVILGRSGKLLDLDATIEAIRKIKVPFAEIWIVGRSLDNRDNVQTVRLYPARVDVAFSLAEALKRTEGQPEIMRRGIRGTGTELYPLGVTYLPIP